MIDPRPIGASLLIAFAVPAAASSDRQAPDRPPSTMTSKEIAAFNDGLDRAHPFYIKCRRIDEIGSLVKKARVCRTNQDWVQADKVGNQNARDTVEAMTRAPVNSSN